MSTARLEVFLETHTPVTEVYHIVYMMTEIHKIFGREDTGDYPMLRFYTDMIVQAERDPLPERLQGMLQDICFEAMRVCDRTPEGTEPVLHHRFFSLENLRKEMKGFLEEKSIPTALTEQHWAAFTSQFMMAFAGEGFKGPMPWIWYFYVSPPDQDSLGGSLGFRDPVNGHHHVNIKA